MIKFTNTYGRSELDLSTNLKDFLNILETDGYIGGLGISSFESELSSLNNNYECITCGNGTDALEAALMFYSNCKKQIVFCPSYSFIATAEAIIHAGFTPWFIDITTNSLTIDVEKLRENIAHAKKAGFQLAGVVCVDIFGNPCNYEDLNEVCKEHDLFLLADSAQSLGAKYKSQSIATYVDAMTVSFYPTKPLGGLGDGGAIITRNPDMASFIRDFTSHSFSFNSKGVGIYGRNSRLDAINAVYLTPKIVQLDVEIAKREQFSTGLKKWLLPNVIMQEQNLHGISSWCAFTLIFPNQNLLNKTQENLTKLSIESKQYYSNLISDHIGYNEFPIDILGLSVSQNASKLALSIPAHGSLSKEEKSLYKLALG